MHFYFYILYSKARDGYYIGFTSDSLEERVRKHNSNHKGFTGGSGDWHLVYSESFNDKLLAMAREKEVKAWKSGKRVEKLIRESNSAGSEHPAV